MLTPEQDKMLDAKLSASNVKTRSQSGRSLSYIESWVAIAEANRIFGFGGWSRETVELRCVSEKEREIGSQKAQGWGVTYMARVRVTVFGVDGQAIVREGSGSGHGIDRDLGQAHESALKEAESDAGKRALMTFGNPFGLALYDKEQAGVEHTPAEKPKSAPPAPSPSQGSQTPPAPESAPTKAQKAEAWAARQMEIIGGYKTAKELGAWETKNQATIVDLATANPEAHRTLLDYVMRSYETLNPVSA